MPAGVGTPNRRGKIRHGAPDRAGGFLLCAQAAPSGRRAMASRPISTSWSAPTLRSPFLRGRGPGRADERQRFAGAHRRRSNDVQNFARKWGAELVNPVPEEIRYMAQKRAFGYELSFFGLREKDTGFFRERIREPQHFRV